MAYIPPYFLDCVVAIGSVNKDDSKHWTGTGFLYGQKLKPEEKPHKKYRIFLVTNKHVLQGYDSVVLKFNPQKNLASVDIPLRLIEDDKVLWTGHIGQDIDVAVIELNAPLLDQIGLKINCYQSDKTVANIQKLKDIGVSEGDSTFTLGFPMGMLDRDRQYVFLRKGSISRIRDLFDNLSTDFIVDSLVFPGNSGGPVILKPEVGAIEGTKINNQAYLIGVVKSYIPFQDVAISQQTKRPRIIFEENSGLALVEPVDHITDTIQVYEKKHGRDDLLF
ncbi:serine protease [Spongiivirga sp. MCCC 1A20706]|uniref:S1 family peptidase n=1 Tax=Spongiivirga sp. MCCC 1A20706 TaxID=3160963 RepID=UPI0039778592